jgi:glycosyltransferase involved in cell wall biosynthesis
MKAGSDTPTVSVLMCVFNGEKYLREAIDSILCQTFTDFEFIIINDKSTDRSVDIIRSYADPRIRLYSNESNIGLTKSLNKGIDLAKGKYIARMDADDISLPDRLATQVEFMESNPHIGVCGTWFELFGDSNSIVSHPINHDEIILKFFNQNAIGHPTVIIKTSVLHENRYNEQYITTQDYELWTRLAISGFKFHNIPSVLLRYRWHNQNISKEKAHITTKNTKEAIRLLYNHLELHPSDIQIDIMRYFINHTMPDHIPVADIITYLHTFYLKNNSIKLISETFLINLLSSYIDKILRGNKNYDIKLFLLLSKNRFTWIKSWSYTELFKLFIKCLLRWKV